MPDETTGTSGEGPPAFPGDAPPPLAPPHAPPVPPPVAPPSYPSAPSGGYPPPPAQYPAAAPSAGADGSPDGAPYAPWVTRLGGYLIDLVIFIPVLIVLAVLFRHTHVLEMHLATRRNGTTRRSFSLLSFVVTGVLFLVYATILCGGARGQTVGMMAVGVRVVRQGTHDVLGFGRAFGRALTEQVLRLIGVVTVILGLVWLLDMLFPLWDTKRQTLHDKVVGTVVIRVRDTG
jgi:uncharacterized RDD family membrane protein YckC